MVKDAGAQAGLDRIKPLNTPSPISVESDTSGKPLTVVQGRKRCKVIIMDTWRIDDEWWRPNPVSRVYYGIVLEDGSKLTVFQDLLTRHWHRQNYD